MRIHQQSTLYSDTTGVLGQPVHLLITIVIITAILFLFLISLHTMTHDIQVQQIRHQLDKILTKAIPMYDYAQEGTVCSVHVTFPSSMNHIVFGATPTTPTFPPTNLTLNEATSNNYYFVMNDGSVYVFHTPVRFSHKDLDSIAVFAAGDHEFSLELCTKNGRSYVAIY